MASQPVDSWNLLSDRVEDGIALLERAGVKGFVMPADCGWVPVVAEEGWISGNPRLTQANTLVALHLVVNSAFWWFEVYDGGRRVGMAGFHGGEETQEKPRDIAGLCKALALNDVLSQEMEAILRLNSRQPQASRKELLHRFLEIVNLPTTATLHFKRVKKTPVAYGASSVSPQQASAKPLSFCNGDRYDCVLFPQGLFGTKSDVSRWASKIATKLWKGESLSSLVPKADQVCGIHASDPIVVENCGSLLDPAEKKWRLYALTDACFRKRRDGGTGRSPNHFVLMMDAMSELWFTLGMLGDFMGFGAALYAAGMSSRRVDFHVFEKFVQWLPELVILTPRMQMTIDFCGGSSKESYWMLRIVKTAVGAGWKPKNHDTPITAAMEIDAMIHDRVIERIDGRYRVTDHFRKAVK